MLQTVNRAGQVLDLFSSARPEWGATAVAHELNIAKSQAHELLVSLADIGLLQRGGPGRYTLGWRIVALNSLLVDTSDVRQEAARVMRALTIRYGETVHLAIWGPERAICIAAAAGRPPAALAPWTVGDELPIHCTGAGKVLLAERPWPAVRAGLERDGLPRMTGHTIVTLDALAVELAAVRDQGYAHERQEHGPLTCGVAAPIRDARGAAIAAVGMSVPAERWRRSAQSYTRALVAAASRTSELVRARIRQREQDLAAVS
jgi:DNA-binding IclR family transcriptional regulator